MRWGGCEFFSRIPHWRLPFTQTLHRHHKRKTALLEHLGRADQSSPHHNENPVLSKCILVKDTVGIIITPIRLFIVNYEYVPIYFYLVKKCLRHRKYTLVISNIETIFEMAPISLRDTGAVSSSAPPRSKACILFPWERHRTLSPT